jgi:hypothetical protein
MKLITTLALALTLASNAATYIVQNAAGNNSSVFVNAAGVRLSGNGASSGVNTSVIGSASFGYFSAETGVTTATTGAELLTNFVQFGTGFKLFNNPTTPTNYLGLFSATATVTGASLTPFVGQSIYAVVTNAATINSGTEYFIFKFNSTFSDSEPVNVTLTLDTASTNGNVLFGSKTGPSLTAAGIDSSAEASFQLASLSAVPETSTSLLGALGALALLRRRRN